MSTQPSPVALRRSYVRSHAHSYALVMGWLLLVLGTSAAQAQDGETTILEEEVIEEDDDETVTMGVDSDAPVGASENPEASSEFGMSEPEKKKKDGGPAAPQGYPLEVTKRPLNLPRNTFEVRLDVPLEVEDLQVQSRLGLAYGITDEIQIGLAYGAGTLNNHEDYRPFIVGKGVEVEARYRLTSWASAQVALPMYVDPFAMGVRMGVPLKFRMFGKLALLFGEDFLTFKTYRFFPLLPDGIYNEDRVGDVDTNTVTSNGELRFVATVQYQQDEKTTFIAEFGFIATNFSTEDPVVPLRVLVNYSPNPKIDLGFRIGFNNLDRATDEFGGLLTAALRI